MLDSLFPKVLSEFTYLSRAEHRGGMKGFLNSPSSVWMVLICWGQEGEDRFCEV